METKCKRRESYDIENRERNCVERRLLKDKHHLECLRQKEKHDCYDVILFG